MVSKLDTTHSSIGQGSPSFQLAVQYPVGLDTASPSKTILQLVRQTLFYSG